MIKLFLADLKLLLRNRQSLFWTLAFPLIFTVIFGFFFSKGSIGGTVIVVNQSSSPLATGLVKALGEGGVFTLKEQADQSGISDSLKKGSAAAAVVIPPHFGEMTSTAPKQVQLIYDPGSAQTRAAVEGMLGAYLNQASYQALKAQPPYGLQESSVDAQTGHDYFDYVLIGLVGMALMNSAIQGLAIAMARYKDDQILKRITTTPLPSWKFVGAEVLSRLVLNLIQVALILGVGVKAFGAHLNGSLPGLVGLSLLGALLFQLLGFLVAAMAKNTDAAEGMAQAITVPMMFLSGVFFSIDQLPGWLYSIVRFLPLSPLLRSMRSVALEQGGLADIKSSLGLIGVWVALLLVLVIYKFRLREE